jgi:RimJ/RimL family protein N-acetyltransferase
MADTLRLRRPGLDDVDALQEAIDESYDDLHPWMDWCTRDAGITATRAWVAMQTVHRDEGTAHEFLILHRSGGILGCCGVNGIDRERRTANLGYWVRTSVAGRGVAVRAAQRLVDWVRKHTDLERLEIVCAVGNTRSQRVAEKVGATREGIETARLRIHGVEHDAVVYVIVIQGR